MSELRAAQRDFAASLQDGVASAALTRRLVGDPASIDRRVALYRANVAASACKALAATYPVIERVVGEELFVAAARAYLRATPSVSGDLGEYGAGFATFLESFGPAGALPYLPDVARLEWCVHLAYGAQDAAAFDHAALASLATVRQGEIRFACAPGSALVASPYPIARIWLIHQDGFDGEFGVDWSIAETALVTRNACLVSVKAASDVEAAFIGAVLQGATVDAACTTALTIDSGADLGALIAHAVATNLICAFTLDQEEA